MRRRAFLPVLLFLTAALAGCSDGGAPDGDDGVGPEVPDDTLSGKGVVRGVVVDESVTPVPDAKVELVGASKDTRTDEEGNFLFNNVEPGPVFVKVTKPGYRDAQQSVDVVADDPRPPSLKVLLESDPESMPYVVEHTFEGFIECSAGAAEAGVNPCVVSEASVNVFHQELDGVPTLIQTELVWEGSSAFGDALWYSHFIPDSSTDGADDYTFADGPSPLLLRSERELLEQKEVGISEDLGLRVFAGSGETATVHVNQPFRIYVHMFYNYEPPEDWRFTADGAPPDAE